MSGDSDWSLLGTDNMYVQCQINDFLLRVLSDFFGEKFAYIGKDIPYNQTATIKDIKSFSWLAHSPDLNPNKNVCGPLRINHTSQQCPSMIKDIFIRIMTQE